MGLRFPSQWRFDEAIPRMPTEAVAEFLGLVDKIAGQAKGPQGVYEIFKTRFGNGNVSTNLSWAQSDLEKAMHGQNVNAVEFIDAFWLALKEVEGDADVPDAARINTVLRKHKTGYAIDPSLAIVKEVQTGLTASAQPDGQQSSAYQLAEKLGGGAYGEVFRAMRGSVLGAFEFAVKFHSPSAFVDEAKARQRFEREAAAVRKLQHRSIVPYVDAGVSTDGRLFLVMPLVRGKTLRDATEGEPGRAIHSVIEVLSGLAYSHGQGVLHRDIKPQNVILRDSDMQPIIVDFGLAYLVEERDLATLTSTAPGTAAYVPHEVMNDPKRRTVKHDVYSCGVMLYELIARRIPDAANYEPLADLDPRFAPVDAVIAKAISREDRRFSSAAEFRDALGAAAAVAGMAGWGNSAVGATAAQPAVNSSGAGFDLGAKLSPAETVVLAAAIGECPADWNSVSNARLRDASAPLSDFAYSLAYRSLTRRGFLETVDLEGEGGTYKENKPSNAGLEWAMTHLEEMQAATTPAKPEQDLPF